MKVWLDDERPEPEGWVRARTAAEAITLLSTGAVEEISLDHDLGDDAAGTGYDVLIWIERAAVERGFVPPAINVHTANPPARIRMLAAVQAIKRLLAASEAEPYTSAKRLAALPQGYVETVVAKSREALGDALQEVILYGSRAYGRPTPESDVDIALIVSEKTWLDGKNEIKLATHIDWKSKFHMDTQIYVETRDEIESYRGVEISMQAQILEQGIRLYVSDKKPAPGKTVEPKTHVSIAIAWLRQAKFQIDMASESVAKRESLGLTQNPIDTELYICAACWSFKAVLFAHKISCIDRKLRWNLVRLQQIAGLFEPELKALDAAVSALPWHYDQSRYGNHDQPVACTRSKEECQTAFVGAWSIYAKCVAAVERLREQL